MQKEGGESEGVEGSRDGAKGNANSCSSDFRRFLSSISLVNCVLGCIRIGSVN